MKRKEIVIAPKKYGEKKSEYIPAKKAQKRPLFLFGSSKTLIINTKSKRKLN